MTFAVALAGCRENASWRTYDEINVRPGSGPSREKALSAPPPASPAPPSRVTWNTPEGWTEEAGEGMRMAAFGVTHEGEAASCTLISLSGAAGGLEANVRRWMGQLDLPAPGPDELKTFLAGQKKLSTASGLELLLVDLTQLGDPSESTPSILAAVIDVNSSTLFLKLNGSKKLIAAGREAFLELGRSIAMDQGH